MVLCKTEGCRKRAVYGYEHKVYIACNIHRVLEPKHLKMIDVKNKRCFCGKNRPCYGLEEGIFTHCKECKTPDMYDVRNKKCFCGKNKPSFGLIQNKPSHCSECKTPDMYDVFHKKCFCKKYSPNFGLEIGRPTNCSECKTEEMYDVVHKKCKTDDCKLNISNPLYEGYCFDCFIYNYPNKLITRNYRTKEKAVVKYIMERFNNHKWIWDKKIAGGTSKKRPDLFLNLVDKVIIIECNENKHSSYDNDYHDIKTQQLSKDINYKPMLNVNFNPDGYTDKFGKKIKSCWTTIRKTGKIEISDTEEWNKRLEDLGDTVEYWLENYFEDTIKIIELFYD